MNFIFKLFLTLNTSVFILIIYLINKDINLLGIYVIPQPEMIGDWWYNVYVSLVKLDYFNWFVYFLIPLLCSYVSIRLCRLLSCDEVKDVKSIEIASSNFLVNYLALFFVALSIESTGPLIVVFCLSSLLIFISTENYFNPMFLLFRYNFYYLYTNENAKVLLITKTKLKAPNDFQRIEASRINDFTFMEV